MKIVLLILLQLVVLSELFTQTGTDEKQLVVSTANKIKNTESAVKTIKQLEEIKKSVKLTEKIYINFKKASDALNTVRSVVKTSREFVDIKKNILKLSRMYFEYGFTISIKSEYQIENYLSPEYHAWYKYQFKKIYEGGIKDLDNATQIVTDDKLKMDDYSRLKQLDRISKKLRQRVVHAENLIYEANKVAQVNYNEQKRIEFEKQLWSIE